MRDREWCFSRLACRHVLELHDLLYHWLLCQVDSPFYLVDEDSKKECLFTKVRQLKEILKLFLHEVYQLQVSEDSQVIDIN